MGLPSIGNEIEGVNGRRKRGSCKMTDIDNIKKGGSYEGMFRS